MIFNIMVVDDSVTARAFMIKILRVARIPTAQVFQASNGLEALTLLKEHEVDLVFADIHMPVMDGIELIERMSQAPDLRRIPVVVVTSEGSCQRIEMLRSAGVAAYVRKPANPALLHGVIYDALNIETSVTHAH